MRFSNTKQIDQTSKCNFILNVEKPSTKNKYIILHLLYQNYKNHFRIALNSSNFIRNRQESNKAMIIPRMYMRIAHNPHAFFKWNSITKKKPVDQTTSCNRKEHAGRLWRQKIQLRISSIIHSILPFKDRSTADYSRQHHHFVRQLQ